MSIPRVTRTASTGTATTRPVTRARVVAPVAEFVGERLRVVVERLLQERAA
jgi:hypothetical protein